MDPDPAVRQACGHSSHNGARQGMSMMSKATNTGACVSWWRLGLGGLEILNPEPAKCLIVPNLIMGNTPPPILEPLVRADGTKDLDGLNLSSYT